MKPSNPNINEKNEIIQFNNKENVKIVSKCIIEFLKKINSIK
jgi:hypothetical protein